MKKIKIVLSLLFVALCLLFAVACGPKNSGNGDNGSDEPTIEQPGGDNGDNTGGNTGDNTGGDNTGGDNGNEPPEPPATPEYVITLDLGAAAGGDYTISVESIKIKNGETINLPTPACVGLEFRYWSYSGNPFSDEIFAFDADITLVAEWTETVDYPPNV